MITTTPTTQTVADAEAQLEQATVAVAAALVDARQLALVLRDLEHLAKLGLADTGEVAAATAALATARGVIRRMEEQERFARADRDRAQRTAEIEAEEAELQRRLREMPRDWPPLAAYRTAEATLAAARAVSPVGRGALSLEEDVERAELGLVRARRKLTEADPPEPAVVRRQARGA